MVLKRKLYFGVNPDGTVVGQVVTEESLWEVSQKVSNRQTYPCINCTNTGMQGYFLKAYIEERAVEIANYIIEHKATVRQAAKHYGISKSTVHKDITDRLCQVNPALAAETRKIIDVNKSERHIRGGMATKEKYAHLHAV